MSTLKSRAGALNESVAERIDAIARMALAEEVIAVEKLVERAKAGVQETDIVKITPAMAALIFLEHNRWNRQWKGRKVMEYARRMKDGAWRWNGASVSFYDSGNLGDGQHRLGASALAGFTLTVPVVFGIATDSVDTIDDGSIRTGSDHASMDQLKETKSKQAILKAAGAYFARLQPEPMPFDTLGSAAEFHRALRKHDEMLTAAMVIAETCARGCHAPALKRPEAARIAFVMLFGGWPMDQVRHVLHRLQEGIAIDSEGGEKSPLYVAREVLDSRSRGKGIQITKQMGIIVKAATMLQAGIKSSKRVMQSEVDKELPSPMFNPTDVKEAA